MNASIPLLQELQKLEALGEAASSQQRQRMTDIRAQVPVPVLAHYNRLVVNRCKPVAEVRRGICGACHLRLAAWVRQAANDDDLHICENCGAYLVFVPEEAPTRPTAKSVRAKQARLALIRAAVAH